MIRMTLIHKEVSPHGDWIIYMNGVPLYKKWPSGHSVLFDKYGPPITSADRDALDRQKSSTAASVRQPLKYSRAAILELISDALAADNHSRLVTRTATRLFLLACDLLAWKDEVFADAFEETALREHFSLLALIASANADLYPEMPLELRTALNHHLSLLPGFQSHEGMSQRESTWAFHESAEHALLAVLDKMPLTQMVSTSNGKPDVMVEPAARPTSSSHFDENTLRQMVVALVREFTSNDALVERSSDLLVLADSVVRWKEAEGFLDYSLEEVRDHLNLKTVIWLTDPVTYPTMPDKLRASVVEYLDTLPHYREELFLEQSQTTSDEHGAAEMQLTKLLGSIYDTYQHLRPEALDDLHLDPDLDGPFWIRDRLQQRAAAIADEDIPDDILETAAKLDYMRGGPSSIDIAQAIFDERKRSQSEIERLRKAADKISPYLLYTISEDSPGYHPTMPIAVDVFHHAFDIETPAKRLARAKSWLPKKD